MQSSMIPVAKGNKVERNYQGQPEAGLGTCNYKTSDTAQKQPICETGAALKSLGEKSCEKGGSQLMTEMMLMLNLIMTVHC